MKSYIVKTYGNYKEVGVELSKLGELEIVSYTMSLYLLKTNVDILEIYNVKNVMAVRTEEEAYLINQENGMMYL